MNKNEDKALRRVEDALEWLEIMYKPGCQGYTPNVFVWDMTNRAIKELNEYHKKNGVTSKYSRLMSTTKEP